MPMIIEVNAIHSKVYIYTGTNYTAKKHDLHKSVSSILFMTLCCTSGKILSLLLDNEILSLPVHTAFVFTSLT